MKHKLSICIITLNEELVLGRLLRQLHKIKLKHEIVIIDSYSTDLTSDIANEYGAKFITNKFKNYSDQRNFSIENASGDWILMLDADELLSDDLLSYINNEFLDDNKNYECINIPRKNYFMGKWLSMTYPDYQTRLFKNKKYFYEKSVHEKLVTNGVVPYALGCCIEHYPPGGFHNALSKIPDYSYREALDLNICGKAPNGAVSLLIKPILKFAKSYIIDGGYRDGAQGFIWSVLNAIYTFAVIANRFKNTKQGTLL